MSKVEYHPKFIESLMSKRGFRFGVSRVVKSETSEGLIEDLQTGQDA